MVVTQSTTGPGQIILDDSGGAATALNSVGNAITLTAGRGGIVAVAGSDQTAEISSTSAQVTLLTTGPIGTSANPVQFADNTNLFQQNVVLGSATIQPMSANIDGLGSLTLGNLNGSTANTNLTVTARNNLVVGPGAFLNAGSGTISLGADLTPSGTGDDGLGTLSIDGGAIVTSSNTTAGAITLRGADINVDTSKNAAVIGLATYLNSIPSVNIDGIYGAAALAFDSSGNLYVANAIGNSVSKFAAGSTVPTATLTGVNDPVALVVDSSGTLYVANSNGGTVSEFAPGSISPTATLTGLSFPDALALDSGGNLYVAEAGASAILKFAPAATTASATLTGVVDADALKFDSSGDLWAASGSKNTVSEFLPGSTTASITLAGFNDPVALQFDSSGNLYVANAFGNSVSKFAAGSTTTSATLTGLSFPAALAFDASGNLYVANQDGFSVSEFAPGATTAGVTLSGLISPDALAFDSSGNLYVGDFSSHVISEFAPGSTSSSTSLGGLNNPDALAFDSSHDLYVANQAGNTISEFAPGGSIAIATLTGVTAPDALAFDALGSLYVVNSTGTTVGEFAPGSTTVTAILTGLNDPDALAFDASGNLYVANSGNGTVSKFSPGSTTPGATLTGLSMPVALLLDSAGNLYVANQGSNTVSEFAPGSTTPNATLTGLSSPTALALDSAGDLYVANNSNGTVTEFAPGGTSASNIYTGLSQPDALAFDAQGFLYVGSSGSFTMNKFAQQSTTPIAKFTFLSTPQALRFDSSGDLFVAVGGAAMVSEFIPTAAPASGSVTIGSSIESRPMSIGGTNNAAVAGINLTSAELAQIKTTAGETLTIGDSGQTGNITFTTATPATAAGASLMVVQSTTGSGQIILDDGAGTATALNGNGGTISLTAGTGGIVALAGSNSTAEIATTGATVTLITSGPIGSSSNPIQFADNANSSEQNLVIGSASVQPSSINLDGLGTLTLGSIHIVLGTTFNVSTATSLAIATGAMLGLSLSSAPSSGTQITVINDTNTPAGSNVLNGTFSNLAANGTLMVTFQGNSYTFHANYLAGDGNDLVLSEGPSTLTLNGTSTSNLVTVTFTDATDFTVSLNGGTPTSYSLSDVGKVVYNAPTGIFSELVFDDSLNTYSATQSLAATELVTSGFEFDANNVVNLYIYAPNNKSSATIHVADSTGSNNFYVGTAVDGYSYIADPGTGVYSELSGFPSETITGSGGATYAYVYSTSNAQIVGDPIGSTFSVAGLTTNLNGFSQLYFVGAADGSDSITLHSAGGTFVGTPGFDYVSGTSSGSSFLIGALYAANVTAQASTGGQDKAVFYSYPKNTFSGAPATSSLTGSTTNVKGASVDFAVQALGYGAVSVFESGSGSDVADLNSPGQGSFYGTSIASTLTVGTSSITVNSYVVSNGQTTMVPSQIVVTGNHDGSDSATIFDSPGTNALTASGSTAALTTSVNTITINKFGSVTANKQNGSNDTVQQAAIDFTLSTVGNWTSV